MNSDSEEKININKTILESEKPKINEEHSATNLKEEETNLNPLEMSQPLIKEENQSAHIQIAIPIKIEKVKETENEKIDEKLEKQKIIFNEDSENKNEKEDKICVDLKENNQKSDSVIEKEETRAVEHIPNETGKI